MRDLCPRWRDARDMATNVGHLALGKPKAILACLAIIIWHFYHVMFDPDVYPMNFAWWDGKVSKKWQEEEHPLEVEDNESSTEQEK